MFLLGDCPWRPSNLIAEQTFISVNLSALDEQSRTRLWEGSFNDGLELDGDIDWRALAGKFQFTRGQVQDATLAARNLVRWQSPDDGKIRARDLYAACRAQSNQALSRLARKVASKYTWKDIVLSDDALTQMRGICQRVEQRHRVLSEWGFDGKLSTVKSVNALFAGFSGTGKTMAAEIIANELGLDLYKIDLSRVVSKYIGETEKNLERIFQEAQSANAILLFDEADALFGKRSK